MRLPRAVLLALGALVLAGFTAGEARAVLDPGDVVECEALGDGFCVQFGDPNVLGEAFFWAETADGNDPLFAIQGNFINSEDPSFARSILVVFQDFANADNLAGAGFILSEINPDPDQNILITGVDYFDGDNAEWTSFPDANPFVVNSGLPGNSATIEWTDLAGADFSTEQSGGVTARINLEFVPEPGTTLLLGSAVLGFGLFGRSRKPS